MTRKGGILGVLAPNDAKIGDFRFWEFPGPAFGVQLSPLVNQGALTERQRLVLEEKVRGKNVLGGLLRDAWNLRGARKLTKQKW